MCLEYREVSDKISYFNDLICIYVMRVPFKYRTSEHRLNACVGKGCLDVNEAGYFEGKNYIWPWVEILGQRWGNTPCIQNYFTWYPSFPDSKSLDNIFTQKYPYSLKKIFFFTQIEASACLHYVSMHVYHEIAECMYDA